jgi:hypothetical protein
LDYADEQLSRARLVGDLAIAAFFSSSKEAARKARLDELSKQLTQYLGPDGKITDRETLTAAEQTLRSGPHPIRPFHWHIEFPEVFDRDNPGFDAIVGNPPFAGVTTLSDSTRLGYTDFLRQCFPGSGGKCDLVAFFFRRAFSLLRNNGCFGLIATNTIAQGDTRESGLAPIRQSGGVIFSATKRLKWPGVAAVIVSVMHVYKGTYRGQCSLDERVCEGITAYLLDRGGDAPPARLRPVIPGVSKGVVPYGNGFLVDDSDPNAISSIDVDDVLLKEPRSRSRVMPYISGEDLNNAPDLVATRQIVHLSDLDEDEARSFGGLWKLLEKTVRPHRGTLTDQSGAERLKIFLVAVSVSGNRDGSSCQVKEPCTRNGASQPENGMGIPTVIVCVFGAGCRCTVRIKRYFRITAIAAA